MKDESDWEKMNIVPALSWNCGLGSYFPVDHPPQHGKIILCLWTCPIYGWFMNSGMVIYRCFLHPLVRCPYKVHGSFPSKSFIFSTLFK